MSALVAPNIESLSPYEPGKPIEELARELGVSGAIKLASNENPLGPSPKAVLAISQALAGLHRYPDAAGFALRAALARKLGVDASEILLGNGSNEILEILVRTFCTPADHAVFAEPSFVVYGLATQAHGVDVSVIPLDSGHRHDLDAMRAAITNRTRLVFIANPNNPTGTYVTRTELTRFLESLPEDILVVLDEAYFEYADAPDYPDGLSLRGVHPALAVLRTFSKAYGLAALRVGYAVLPALHCDYANRVRAPFNVNGVAQVAALAALEDEEHLARGRALNAAERRRVGDALTALGVTVVPSQANFLYVDVGKPGREVYDALLRRGVIVRALGPGSKLRITLGTKEENDRLLREISVVLG